MTTFQPGDTVKTPHNQGIVLAVFNNKAGVTHCAVESEGRIAVYPAFALAGKPAAPVDYSLGGKLRRVAL